MRFSLKPVFIGWIVLVMQLPLQLFLTVWAGMFFGGMTSFLFAKDNNLSFVVFGAAAFFGVPIFTYVGKKLNYARTEYRFFDDRLEFDEGFFTQNRKIIRYSDIKETTLRKGMFQRIYGLGSVYLATLATGSSASNNVFGAFGFGNISASGVTVRDIADPDDTYEKIRRLVDARV